MSITPRTDEVKDRRLAPEKPGITWYELSKQLETELAAMTARAEKSEAELAGLRAEVGRLLERIDGERGYSIEVENELQVLREKVSELEDNLDVTRHRLDEAEGDAEQMEKDLNFKISELEDLLAEDMEERK